ALHLSPPSPPPNVLIVTHNPRIAASSPSSFCHPSAFVCRHRENAAHSSASHNARNPSESTSSLVTVRANSSARAFLASFIAPSPPHPAQAHAPRYHHARHPHRPA